MNKDWKKKLSEKENNNKKSKEKQINMCDKQLCSQQHTKYIPATLRKPSIFSRCFKSHFTFSFDVNFLFVLLLHLQWAFAVIHFYLMCFLFNVWWLYDVDFGLQSYAICMCAIAMTFVLACISFFWFQNGIKSNAESVFS